MWLCVACAEKNILAIKDRFLSGVIFVVWNCDG